jgi:hypothetical protein
MQPMSHAFAVLGSRHGLLFDPQKHECGMIRFDRFTRLPPVDLRAGIVLEGKEYILPLGKGGEAFDFCDQRITPCTVAFIGLHADSAIKFKLTVTVPFRPRDAAFSTTPVLHLRLQATPLGGMYRWTRKSVKPEKITLFLEIGGERMDRVESGTDSLDLRFESVRSMSYAGMPDVWQAKEEKVAQTDRLVALRGERRGTRFQREVALKPRDPDTLDVAWCAWSEPVLEVQGVRFPFKYTERFASLADVAAWARENPDALPRNAARVDGIVRDNTCSQSVNNLMVQTLHSWLIDSWWGVKDGRDWFSVWEGSCYFHSTVDVEYTQTPFYLAVWPELLGIELDWWPEYSKPGETAIGERGKGTLFLSHDMGAHATANGQIYSHDMEVEEATNYVLMAFVHWKRTGDERIVRKHAETIRKYLEFCVACDTTGNGVPDLGVANTIDDASPAIQFGKEQMYLGVKTLAAFVAGSDMMALVDAKDASDRYAIQADRIRRTIHHHGWNRDHFNTLLRADGELTNPWTGKSIRCEQIPGWDAPHIYTVNGLALLDMVGVSTGLHEEWIRRDLDVATARCLREYGCAHTDFAVEDLEAVESMIGLAGVAANPGWISMNMLRDISAFYRGVDLRGLADRYWAWQTTSNSQERKVFFETFCGNNLCFYPRGVAIWGYFDALAGRVIDRTRGLDLSRGYFPNMKLPRLLDATWSE